MNNSRFVSVLGCALLALCITSLASATSVSFSGRLSQVVDDDGSGVYSGVPIDTNFTGTIDIADRNATGFLTDGATRTAFGCCIAASSSIENNNVLDADSGELIAILNGLAGSQILKFLDVVDGLQLEGDSLTASGSRIEIGLTMVLDSTAFENEIFVDNIPFNPDDVLVTIFSVLEERNGKDIYTAIGIIDALEITELARFENSVLTLPVVAVGDTSYRVELSRTNEQTFEFQLGAVEVLSNPNTLGISNFSDGMLRIPRVVVGGTSYRVALSLTDASTFTFSLSDAEVLQ